MSIHANKTEGVDQKGENNSSAKSDYAGKGRSQASAAINSARTQKSSAAFRTISEVADELGVQQHVLRFWETKFTHIKPLKRGGGRRYYRPEDVSLIKAIHRLLYVEGYTIKGVQKLFRDVGKKQVVLSFGEDALGSNAPDGNASSTKSLPTMQGLTEEQRETLVSVLDELKELRGMMRRR